MLKFILRRTFYSVFILIGVLILTFVLFRVAAGDPSATLLGKNAKPEDVERLRASLGADKPFFYGKWRKTEAFTNIVFVNFNTKFGNAELTGNFTAGKNSIEMNRNARLVLRRNFIPVNKMRIDIGVSKTVRLNGHRLTPENGVASCEFELESIPDTLTLEALEDKTTMTHVTSERMAENPFDSQLLASLKEVVTFKKAFPYVSFFNFGETLLTKENIRSKMWSGMWPSLIVMFPVFIGEFIIAVIFAMISCVFRGRFIDRFIVVLSVAGMSISYLALIIFGQWLLGYYWNWFPVWGWGGLEYLVLPVIIGIISGVGGGVRFYRTVFLNEINREYLRTAKAKGVAPIKIYASHLFRNSLVPIITRLSSILPFLFTGSLLLESFFGIPGLGTAGINALHDADLQMLKALVILSSLMFVVINLLTDIAYAYVDPRMRLK